MICCRVLWAQVQHGIATATTAFERTTQQKNTSANRLPTNKQNALGFSLLSVTFESDPGNEQQVEAEETTESPCRSEAGESGLCFLHVRIKVILGTECCLYSNNSTLELLDCPNIIRLI